jgi:hypothetical protein
MFQVPWDSNIKEVRFHSNSTIYQRESIILKIYQGKRMNLE